MDGIKAGRVLKRLTLVPAVLIVLLSVSCRSLPEGPHPDVVDWIPPESGVTARLKVQENPELTEMLLGALGQDPDRMQKLTDRTAVLAFGLELSDPVNPDSSLPIHLASIGIWPRSIMGTALGKEWKRSGVSRHRWNGPDGLELTALSGNEIILSNGRTDEMISRIQEGQVSAIYESGLSMDSDADFAVWINDAAFISDAIPYLPASASGTESIVQIISLTLKRAELHSYAMELKIYPSDEKLNRSLALALRLGLSARFGLSPNPEERLLMSDMTVLIEEDHVALRLSNLNLTVMEGLLGNMAFLPEVVM